MGQLKPGDRVNCRVNQHIIVGPYEEYDQIHTFEIVGFDTRGYYLYVPPYIMIKGSSPLDHVLCRKLNIDAKFLGSHAVYIFAGLICQVKHIVDGLACVKCQDFFQMAEPNQEDGTLVCWSCRDNPYR